MAATFISPKVGIMGLAGVTISNLIAYWLKFDSAKIRTGFYGFNGILFGAAAAYFFEFTPTLVLLTLLFLVIVFFLTATLEHLMANVFNLPGLSLPFILSLYIFFIFLTNYSNIFYSNLHLDVSTFGHYFNYYVLIYFKSLGLIILQTHVLAGIVIALGLLLFSRVMFVNSIFAFAINLLLLQLIYPKYDSTFLILTSFNSILTAFALGGSLILVSRKTFALITLSSMLVIVFTSFFAKILVTQALPVLVLPFNFIVLSTIYSLKFREEQSDFVLLYFAPGSPEENYYYDLNRKARFERFKYLLPELPFWGEWKVSQGFNGAFTHKDDWRYAWDFVIVDEKEKEFENDGFVPEDYYCYSTPVVAPLDGRIVNVVDNVPDNEIGKNNLENNWGNSIVIDHGEGLFSQLSHLKRGSIKVKIGDWVKKGEVLAQCGNSGRSPYPHLHFQFQLTDRVGDKTYKFPIANFLVKEGETFHLKAFEFPKQNTIVKNVETHKEIREAFNFQLGDELKMKCKLNGKEFTEKWEVKVDIYNLSYFENERGDKAYFILKDKVFIMTDYIGKKYSALYYFYLTAVRVPLGYSEQMVWQDRLPVSFTLNNLTRYASEFFLMFGPQLNSDIEFKFLPRSDADSDYKISGTLSNKGKGIFSFYNESGSGYLTISTDGKIKEFAFEFYGKKFYSEIE